MASATKKKPKGTTRRRVARADKPAPKAPKSSATLTPGGTEDDPKQNYIEGFEPERDEEIETAMDPWIDAAKTEEKAKATISECRTSVTDLLRNKQRSSYRYKGYTAKFKPGDDTALLSKPKQK